MKFTTGHVYEPTSTVARPDYREDNAMKPTIKAAILRTLQQHGDLSTKEVAYHCHLTYFTASKYLRSMAARGEIAVHGRGVYLYTTKGRAA